MHEYSIISSLVDRVRSEAEPRGARPVQLYVAIGELAGVDVNLLLTAYDTFRERTICERAGLHVRNVAAEWRCTKCDVAIEKGALLRCRGCGRPARLVQGDEIVLERIEMEVPDVQ